MSQYYSHGIDSAYSGWGKPERVSLTRYWSDIESGWPQLDVCAVSHYREKGTSTKSNLVTDEISHLRSLLQPGDVRSNLVDLTQALALRIVSNASMSFTSAGFLSDEGIEFIIANHRNSRRAYLDLSIEREEAWVHLIEVGSPDRDQTISMKEDSSISAVSGWLRG